MKTVTISFEPQANEVVQLPKPARGQLTIARGRRSLALTWAWAAQNPFGPILPTSPASSEQRSDLVCPVRSDGPAFVSGDQKPPSAGRLP